jgi:hypothetical protein
MGQERLSALTILSADIANLAPKVNHSSVMDELSRQKRGKIY